MRWKLCTFLFVESDSSLGHLIGLSTDLVMSTDHTDIGIINGLGMSTDLRFNLGMSNGIF